MVTAGNKYLDSLGEFLELKVSSNRADKAERFSVKQKIGSPWTVVIQNKDEPQVSRLSEPIAIDFGKNCKRKRKHNIYINNLWFSAPAIKINRKLLPIELINRIEGIEKVLISRNTTFPNPFWKDDITAICLHRAHSENFKVCRNLSRVRKLVRYTSRQEPQDHIIF